MKNQIERPNQTHNTALHWGISKAQDTYGYNIASLNTPMGRVRTCGGGEDMTGKVLGGYLERLLTDEQKQTALDAGCYGIGKDNTGFYIEGACGVNSMIKLAKKAGWQVEHLYNYDRKGRVKETVGFKFTPIED